MRKLIRFRIIPVAIACIFLFAGCMKDKVKITRTFQISIPVYESLAKMRQAIKGGPATTINAIGRISVQGHYLFINDVDKGVHIIDNSDPLHPKNISFINIPGNEDISIKGSVLYADSYGDLVSFDISDPLHVVAKNFLSNAFPEHSNYAYNVTNNDDPASVQVVTGWVTKDTTVTDDQFIYPDPIFYAAASATGAAPGTNSVGTNGSTSRFTIIDNYLYTVDFSNLHSIDISNSFSPAFYSSVEVDYHVETIYPFKNRLFVGTNSGVFMYDVQSDPGQPLIAGQFTHARGCDPVVADNNYAYVTINDSSACLGFNNELQVVDITDIGNSFLVKSYQLTHPVGLAKDGNLLFIGDGKGGLRVYDATDVSNLQLLTQLQDAEVFDVIAKNGLAIVFAKDGIYQYDYTNTSDIHLLSKL